MNHLLLAFSYLARCLHFKHGLQPTLDELGGAEHQRGEDGCHWAGAGFLHVTNRNKRIKICFIYSHFITSVNKKDSLARFALPQHSFTLQSGRVADDLLAEAVAHEEHRVLGNVGHQCRRGALVETADAHLFVGGRDAVDETAVHRRKGLHLDLCRVQRLPTEDARGSPSEEDKVVKNQGIHTHGKHT